MTTSVAIVALFGVFALLTLAGIGIVYAWDSLYPGR